MLTWTGTGISMQRAARDAAGALADTPVDVIGCRRTWHKPAEQGHGAKAQHRPSSCACLPPALPRSGGVCVATRHAPRLRAVSTARLRAASLPPQKGVLAPAAPRMFRFGPPQDPTITRKAEFEASKCTITNLAPTYADKVRERG